MSFNQNTNGRVYAPGWFLAEEDCSRETAEISASHSQAVTIGATKIVPAGAVIPSNDGNAKGILYEDVEVTTGNMPGSIVTRGAVYEDRLPAAIESTAEAVLPGIKVITATPAVIRPDFNIDGLTALTVTSSASATTAGDTALTVSGYTLKSGEAWKYKVTTGTAETVLPGEVVSGWTAWDGDDEITAATGKKLALVAVNSAGQAIAYGSCTVTAKAGG